MDPSQAPFSHAANVHHWQFPLKIIRAIPLPVLDPLLKYGRVVWIISLIYTFSCKNYLDK